jgi:hypothetical protein
MANTIFPFRISQLDHMKSDDYLSCKFDMPQIPDSDTYRLHLHRFSRKNLVQLKRVIKQLLQDKNMKKKLKELEFITIDIDSTLVDAYGNQEKVTNSYKTKTTGNKYYHPLLASIFEVELMINFLLRSGNAYTSKSAIHFIKQLLLIIPVEFHHKLVIRADSGFFDEKILDFLEAHHIQYVIKAKSYGSFDELIRKMNHRKFAPKTKDIQFARDEFKLNRWKKTRKFLIIKKKIYVNDQRELKNKAQIQLPFKLDNYYYEYSFIVFKNNHKTNQQLFRYYCQRGSFENYLKEYKHGFGGSDIATEKFVANYANMMMKVLAYNVFSLFKQLILKDKFANKTIWTIRYFLIYIPGKLIKQGQHYYLSLIKNYKYISYFREFECALSCS